MWPVIFTFVRTYAPYVVFPVAVTVGFVGYNYEAYFRNTYTPFKEKSIQEERDARLLEEMKTEEMSDVASLKSKPGVPKSILNRNDRSRLKEPLHEQKNL